jgi:hypothetical protein
MFSTILSLLSVRASIGAEDKKAYGPLIDRQSALNHCDSATTKGLFFQDMRVRLGNLRSESGRGL